MFDKLIESTKQKQRGRTGKFFFITSLVYCVALATLGILAVFWFNPTLVGAVGVDIGRIAPPPPPGEASLPVTPIAQNARPTAKAPVFVAPKDILDKVTPPALVPPGRVATVTDVGMSISRSPCVPPCIPGGLKDGIPGGTNMGVPAPVPPPPPPPPTPKVEPTPTPTPKTEIRMTSQLLQGNAIRKVQPLYPQMARAIRLAGSVQVQVMISESGLVTDAFALNGHPFFRDISVEAARQWVFKPAILNGQPVRVTGVITFNFRLDQ